MAISPSIELAIGRKSIEFGFLGGVDVSSTIRSGAALGGIELRNSWNKGLDAREHARLRDK